LNNQLLPPDAWWRYEFTPPAPGLCTFTAAVTDTGGHTTKEKKELVFPLTKRPPSFLPRCVKNE
jgi:hypothetical protein